MNHPYETAHNANTRHQQMIQAADKFRRIKTLSRSRSQPDIFGRIWQFFSLTASQKVETSADPAVR